MGLRLRGVRQGDGPEVDDPRRRRPQRANARDAWLQLPDPLRTEDLQALYAVGGRPLAERLEPRQLGFAQRHDQLARVAEGDAVLGGEPLDLDLPSRQSVALSEPGA